MTHHYARLIAVVIATVSFSTPLYAQQEPTPSPTWETLLETVVGFTRIHERVVFLFDVTDAGLEYLRGWQRWSDSTSMGPQSPTGGLAHLTGLPSLQRVDLYRTEVTAAGLVHLQKMPALRRLGLSGYASSDRRFTDAGHSQPTGGASERPDRQRGTKSFPSPFSPSMRGRRAPASRNSVPVDPLVVAWDPKVSSLHLPLSSVVNPRSGRRRSANGLVPLGHLTLLHCHTSGRRASAQVVQAPPRSACVRTRVCHSACRRWRSLSAVWCGEIAEDSSPGGRRGRTEEPPSHARPVT